MSTTMMMKIDKELRDDAKRTAAALGVPLTTVVSALLKQFVRERQILISLEPMPTKAKMKLFEEISKEMDKNKKTQKSFSNVEDLLRDLKLV